ncbi:MAG: phosphate transport system ATP-binding protein [Frankiaceae bacterium]|nr:phosphate transport system ATP-binding protein [Frankiaceae bacterium]
MSVALRIETIGLSCGYRGGDAVADVSLLIEPKSVTSIIGPSGCGKSTFLRALNRLHEETPGATVSGQVLLDDDDIYGPGVDPVEVRRLIGMVFQKPNPFPTMSIFDNVASGLRLAGVRRRDLLTEAVHRALRDAGLWGEVVNRLDRPATALSGGQQQRLCIARAIAVQPQVLLMDEPCSALDPISTLAIEDLVTRLKDDYTIVIVTHNMQQAARVSDTTAFFTVDGPGRPGRMVETGPTEQIFRAPTQRKTEDYITGRFG